VARWCLDGRQCPQSGASLRRLWRWLGDVVTVGLDLIEPKHDVMK
jgi:hypothetical protein